MILGWQIWVWLNAAVMGAVAIATMLGLASPVWWWCSYLDYPRPQYALLLVICLTVGLVLPQPWSAKSWWLVGLIPLVVNTVLLGPVLFPGDRPAGTATMAHLSVIHATYDHQNPDPSRLVAYLEQQTADVVSILEVKPDVLPQLTAGLTRYQLAAAELRTNSHGSAWFVAKAALAQGLQIVDFGVIHLPADSDRPILALTLSVQGEAIALVCFHSIRPQSGGRLAYQAKEFEALAAWSQQPNLPRHRVAIGDFNTTPWAYLFRQTLQVESLVNSQMGFGLQPTWPSQLPAFLRIPIDHCLHSPSLQTRQRRVGAKIGSDHLPIVVELGWNRAD